MGLSKYSNWDLEAEIAKPWDLKALIHTRIKKLPMGLKNNSLIKDTALAWQMKRHALSLTATMSRHTPIQHNPNFR